MTNKLCPWQSPSKPETSPSLVTLVKSFENKSQNFCRSLVKCRQNVNFEKIFTKN